MRKASDAIHDILASGGTMGALMLEADWSESALGAPGAWCAELRAVISICLNAPSPMALYWGPDHSLLYNDAWIPILGDRHPRALGRRAHEVWPEVWEDLEPRFKQVCEQGRSISAFNRLYPLERHGYAEESYFNYTLSPIRDRNGAIVGIFNPVQESTQWVLSERRRLLLYELADGTAGARSADQVIDTAASVLASGSRDITFCLIYSLSADQQVAQLRGRAGIEAGASYCPSTIDLSSAHASDASWPLYEVLQTRRLLEVCDLNRRFSQPLPGGAWPEAARSAAVVPVEDSTRASIAGFLIVGISPRRAFDEPYQLFVQHAADGIRRAIGIANEHDREQSELRRRLDKIASIAPVAIHEFRIGQDGAMSMPYSTPAITDIYGATPEAIAADVSIALKLINPQDMRRGYEELRASRKANKPARIEWRVSHPTKGEIWVELRTVAAEQPDGSIVWYGYCQDVTERKQMEEALREREARFRQLAENIQEVFWLTDQRDPRFLIVSPAYEKIWGRSSASLHDRPEEWLDSIHPDDRERVQEAATHQAEGTYDLEYRVVQPDGSIRIVHDRAFPIRNETGEVYRVAGIATDITLQKERESEIRFLAYHDALTKLPNRELLADRLDQAIAHSRHSGRALALMFVDLDRFKTINDSLGHGAGDALLRQAAQRLAATLRTEDTVARAGGDEFLLLVADLASAEDAALTAERILACLAKPFVLGEHSLRVTASVGISICPRDATDAASLIKFADAALYAAKEQGRNTFRYFSPELDARVHARMHLENDLRVAVDREQFLLHYQPKFDVRRRMLTGVEALIRWQHPEKGLIRPTEFIPVAEETGMIVPIGEWGLRKACAQARAWHDGGVRDLRVEVNISSRQLHGDDFIATVERVLADTGCNPRWLGLEITESAAMADPAAAIRIVRTLHAMGIEMAIDDFGTGYSSLTHLKRFALDLLKIDGSFIEGLPLDRDDVAIVQAIIALGHEFRLEVVAEGVETPAQEAFLQKHRCDAIQGFLLSKPLGTDEVWPLLKQWCCRDPYRASSNRT